MYPPIFAVCSIDAGVQAALGTDPVRLYPFGRAPQNTARAYAVWQTVGGAPENYLGCAPDIDREAIQIDVYAAAATDARAAAEALRDAIEPKAHIVRWGGESQDPKTNHYRYSFDVDWWTHR